MKNESKMLVFWCRKYGINKRTAYAARRRANIGYQENHYWYLTEREFKRVMELMTGRGSNQGK